MSATEVHGRQSLNAPNGAFGEDWSWQTALLDGACLLNGFVLDRESKKVDGRDVMVKGEKASAY